MVSLVFEAIFRFYAELNEYLPPIRRGRSFPYRISQARPLRQVIIELGVPPEKAGLVLVNGHAADLDQEVEQGDRVSVYPAFRTLNIRGGS